MSRYKIRLNLIDTSTQFYCHNVTSWTFAELPVNDRFIRYEKDMKFCANDKRKMQGCQVTTSINLGQDPAGVARSFAPGF
ncbi:MAG: hypothetical protein CVT49_15840 [candidate division Zixibacteria bacterium HGW-Zixibacteria-1]|nr:MAG: hypothetical protein CVT49_15840 [candidate division Zixibacteria bacterium HGW-Zixibacteria-1]